MTTRDADADPKEVWLEKESLHELFETLAQLGYQVVGPKLDQGAIIYSEINSPSELPRGWTDRQSAGQYRAERSSSNAFFEFNVGPQSWKQYLFPPKVTVQTATRNTDGAWKFDNPSEPAPKLALLGVRACELAAIAIQDRVFLGGPYVDQDYRRRRDATLIIAVNCTVANQNCFCHSTNTGPRCKEAFDLALTETEEGFVVEVGSELGLSVAARLSPSAATSVQQAQADRGRQRAVHQLGKELQTDGLPQLLRDNLEHPHWDNVAERCLSCTNCTMVCPTCFCSTVSEVSDLTGDQVDRERQWDSCFNVAFSYTSGGTVRNDVRSRYRQWLTHKLSSWHDQFDSSGCVGCGRCITWCPVGIDLREEVAALREPTVDRRSLPIAGQAAVACDVPKPSPSTETSSPQDGVDP
ncbi:MAG: 4Fe-4S dicluster domain-containing protein [Rubripirellula sp.]